jgi:hypothetical protein
MNEGEVNGDENIQGEEKGNKINDGRRKWNEKIRRKGKGNE